VRTDEHMLLILARTQLSISHTEPYVRLGHRKIVVKAANPTPAAAVWAEPVNVQVAHMRTSVAGSGTNRIGTDLNAGVLAV
jgi:hypothetical protein